MSFAFAVYTRLIMRPQPLMKGTTVKDKFIVLMVVLLGMWVAGPIGAVGALVILLIMRYNDLNRSNPNSKE